MQSQEAIERRVVETYMRNMDYFASEHPELYKKLAALDHAIERGYHTPRYDLIYQEEGYFDVIEPASGTYMYGKDSNVYAEKAAESIDFRKEGNLFETFHFYRFSKEDAERLNKEKIDENGMSAIAPVMHYTSQFSTPETTMRRIQKFIFIGAGLGTHITKIHERLNSEVYMIIEEDLELFRLSLFVTAYHAIAGESTLYFSVFDESEEFRNHFDSFLEDRFIYNHYLKYFFMLSAKEELLKRIQGHLASQGQLLFAYNALLANYIKPLQHLSNGYRILDIHALSKKKLLKDKPVLMLAAGPSMGRHIDWIKKHRDKFVLVAVTAILPKLEAEGIRPDIITHVHSFEDSHVHLDRLKSIDFIKDSIAIFSASTPVSFVRRFDPERLFLIEGVTTYKRKFGTFSASNVGNFSAGLLFLLGASEIYLLGLDLAMDQKTGHTHIDAHSFVDRVDLNREEELEEAADLKNSLVEVEGNFAPKVRTSLLFHSYIYEYAILVDGYKREWQQVYNMSEGALLEASEPLHPETLKTEEWQHIAGRSFRSWFAKELGHYAADTLDSEELALLDGRLAYGEKVRKTLREYRGRKYRNIDDFQYHLIGLMIELLGSEEEQTLDLSLIYLHYFQYIMGFVFDLCNTEELENHKHHIKKINKILIQQLEKIERVYEQGVQEYLKKREDREERVETAAAAV